MHNRIRLLPDRPVQQSGIEMIEAVLRRQLFGERALAAGGRAIDGDDGEGHLSNFLI